MYQQTFHQLFIHTSFKLPIVTASAINLPRTVEFLWTCVLRFGFATLSSWLKKTLRVGIGCSFPLSSNASLPPAVEEAFYFILLWPVKTSVSWKKPLRQIKSMKCRLITRPNANVSSVEQNSVFHRGHWTLSPPHDFPLFDSLFLPFRVWFHGCLSDGSAKLQRTSFRSSVTILSNVISFTRVDRQSWGNFIRSWQGLCRGNAVVAAWKMAG